MKKRFSEVHREELLKNAQQCLWNPEGDPGLSYLRDQRKLSDEIIRSFGLGYVPVDINHQLAGRVIIPLYDASDNLIILTSRLVIATKHDLPTYWHESYKKNFYLYGIHKAKSYIRKWGCAVVTEGQFDVLQLYNHGVKNAVGLCCSKMSNIQLSLIKRYCNEILLILDNDEHQAGQIATKKLLSKYGNFCRISSMSIDRGCDPDELIKKRGGKMVREMIRNNFMQMRKKYAEN